MIFVSALVLHANKKPPPRPVNLNTATSLELGARSRHWAVGRGQNSENTRVVRPVQTLRRFAHEQRNRAEAHGKNTQVRYGREDGGRPKTGKRRNNKILDSSVCLQINIRAATENRESESADTALVTAPS